MATGRREKKGGVTGASWEFPGGFRGSRCSLRLDLTIPLLYCTFQAFNMPSMTMTEIDTMADELILNLNNQLQALSDMHARMLRELQIADGYESDSIYEGDPFYLPPEHSHFRDLPPLEPMSPGIANTEPQFEYPITSDDESGAGDDYHYLEDVVIQLGFEQPVVRFNEEVVEIEDDDTTAMSMGTVVNDYTPYEYLMESDDESDDDTVVPEWQDPARSPDYHDVIRGRGIAI